jgi:hypothetical protein
VGDFRRLTGPKCFPSPIEGDSARAPVSAECFFFVAIFSYFRAATALPRSVPFGERGQFVDMEAAPSPKCAPLSDGPLRTPAAE